jgi:hypothetical protein
MFDILSLIPGKKRQTPSGWTSFNAICCGHKGHRPDTRFRGGVIMEGKYNWKYHCFNCNFSCGFTLGQPISDVTRMLLSWCGVDTHQIMKWNLESLQNRDLLDFTQYTKISNKLEFNHKDIPEGFIALDETEPQHSRYVEYLKNRKVDLSKYNFYVNPTGMLRKKNGIVVPYYYKGKLVGNTIRFLDEHQPKYINDQQPGYVFNYDNQKSENSVCIVTEGIFDAISIDGLAVMHDTISEEQARMIANLNKQVIVVPDFDKTGMGMINRALDLGYHVSLPPWGDGVKDVNDAVIKYGKLPTLMAILQNATMSKIKIELRKKQIGKGL